MSKIEISFQVSKHVDGNTDCVVPGFVDVRMLVNGKGMLLDSPISDKETEIFGSKVSCTWVMTTFAKTNPEIVRAELGIEPADLISAVQTKRDELWAWAQSR